MEAFKCTVGSDLSPGGYAQNPSQESGCLCFKENCSPGMPNPNLKHSVEFLI